MSRKVAMHNLGCKVNAYETQAMTELLKENGYEMVPFKPGADIYIINTCSVTNIADRKSRQMLHKARKLNPAAIVVACGCYVETSEGERDPVIDIAIGNNRKKDLISILEEYDQSKEVILEEVIDINHTNEYEELELNTASDHTRAYIKVQDGCNQFCSYCIIPYARGRVRSRSMENVVLEVERLVNQGYKEVVLTGIHLSSYGIDLDTDLLALIKSINQIEGLYRIRLGSLEPRIITEEFVRELSEMDKFCPHFHLSLQSGCNETLKRMNRKYTTEEYEASCSLIRQYFEHPALTTDIIVGFPGETKEEFEASREFVERIHFYETHIFKYSKRQGTKAANMENQVSDQEKARRSEILLELNRLRQREFEDELIGKTKEILIEEVVETKKGSYQVGYTKEYVKIQIRNEDNQRNVMKNVPIVSYSQISH
ncbi:threonylcarbamoyladenosine tRNA methylthiotransferase MtaB [Aequitasia blattaphilus]|uniref:tRNA (N(6)-L-threonylcarbamoyladenosine(37)-C(2))-methylthiotransferase MtaB n=1 Tax=Aequitasia blattaphilus TaxID=2949332 RepID=A0ABT1E7H3_9FIRM|nr:tRNA (N(6)-L-threonylcarbamoyladenosine(37)-C(2))-methylthiotransferase MtaB [Aequitasia blattaphilus]MCP1101776.1 tRNA (N(6)-L-threonylcarbamoyladenosine(37)-C(2))-methylthiotransferase MtaB [Aequitasia blattaphilus]MCR8614416.1 tRNA (N(6)-L-threonylcarbamoyladenosine(37)-C(2))-methylthiotransferase MtaB [Aequitasia blattaphilus]